MGADRRLTHWMGDAKQQLSDFPVPVKKQMGFDIGVLQDGDMPEHAEPMHGFEPQVLAIHDNHKGDTYRCCVTVRLEHRVYILHAFKKKSTQGAKTPQREQEIIRRRLLAAKEKDAEFSRNPQQRQQQGA